MQINRKYCLLLCTLALVAGARAGATEDIAYTGGAYPEHAKPGEVWCLITTPPQFKTVSEEYMCQPASCRFEKIPAVYKTETEQVVCQKERKRCIDIPAVYETVCEQVCSKPEGRRCIKIPAEYETRTEQVICRPESTRCINIPAVFKTESYEVEKCASRTEWQNVKCDNVNVSVDGKEQKGKCVALVVIPATFETLCKQVCVTPCSTRTEVIPAEYKTIEKRVCVKPCSETFEVIPAEFKSVDKRVCVKPCSQTFEVIPAVYKTVEKRVCTCEESQRRIEIPAVYATRTKEVCVGNESKVWRLSSCPAPIGVASCNKCEVKEEKCNTCCDAEQTVFMYGGYNDGETQHIHGRR